MHQLDHYGWCVYSSQRAKYASQPDLLTLTEGRVVYENSPRTSVHCSAENLLENNETKRYRRISAEPGYGPFYKELARKQVNTFDHIQYALCVPIVMYKNERLSAYVCVCM